MMGRQTVDQRQLFYLFNLEDRIPEHHLLRRINPTLTQILGDLRDKLEPFYTEIGRPSGDGLHFQAPLRAPRQCRAQRFAVLARRGSKKAFHDTRLNTRLPLTAKRPKLATKS